jgi:mono/diheme cytochrome c family protein
MGALNAEHFLPKAAMEPFLEDNCIHCHGPEKQKGKVRLDQNTWDLSEPAAFDFWADVLRVLEDQEMPPEEEPRPPAEALQAFTLTLATGLESALTPPTTAEAPLDLTFLHSPKWAYVHSFAEFVGIDLSSLKRASLAYYESEMEQIKQAELLEARKQDAMNRTIAPTFLPHDKIMPFLENNCVRCHGPEKQKGQVRLDNPSFEITNNATAQRWQDVLDVLNSGEMPPEEEPRPASAELIEVLKSLTDSLIIARRRLTDNGGQFTMRRLNQREYANSIRELFGFELSPDLIPADGEFEKFDTVGREQFFSSNHFEKYYELGKKVAAEGFRWSGASLGKAKTNRTHPEAQVTEKTRKTLADYDNKMRMKLEGKTWQEMGFKDKGEMQILFSQFKNRAGKRRTYLKYPLVDTGVYLCNLTGGGNEGTVHFNIGNDPRATYRVRIRAGINDKKKEIPEIRRFIRINTGDHVDGTYKLNASADSPEVIEMLKTNQIGGGGNRLAIYENRADINNLEGYIKKVDPKGEWAAIWIDWVEVEGPFYPRKTNFFGELINPSKKSSERLKKDTKARAFIEQFTYEAFRRKDADPKYIDGLVALFEQNRASGQKYDQAMGEVLGVILASPGFLYIEEIGKRRNSRELDDRELAIRLAYFLWSSPPDDELYRFAKNGALSEPRELRGQVNRMLNDPKAESFYEGFVSQWAELDRFHAITVDEHVYYRFNKGIRHSAYQEVLEFFKVLVNENLPVDNLADSKFVVVNSLLANHYDLKGNFSNEFQKVSLDWNSPRGGLLAQTAFLTLGSNGERTSPVIRGALVLEKMLNDKPPPPPPNVPELGVGSKTPLTNRQMVQLHQDQIVCASCHNKIDPIGFGLENFDTIGRWRDTEIVGNKAVRIEQGGHLVSGIRYRDLDELKSLLRSQKHKLAKELVESLLTYGLGRSIEFSDADAVSSIVNRCRNDDFAMRSMIQRVAASPLFISK